MADSLQWLQWARSLQAIAQNGLTYCQDIFDQQRYLSIQKIAAEIIAAHSQLETQAILHSLQLEEGYATPKVDVRAAVFKDNKILLVQERADGGWAMPGGWAETNTSPSEAVIKEIEEESGYHAKVIKLIALYDYQKHPHPPDIRHIYKCFFLCELTGGQPTASEETTAVDFFAEDSLPPLSTPRTLPHQIHRCFEHHRNLNLPTEFD